MNERRILVNARRGRLVDWLAILALLSIGIVWPAAKAAEPETRRADEMGLWLKSAPDAEPVDALRVSTRIHAKVTGTIARVRIEQRFLNPTDEWVEGLYVYPLAAGSAVDELSMRVGDRVVRGEIRPKEEARALYARSRDAGQRASLVEQQRPNLFSTVVANIAPHAQISVQIEYLDSIPLREGRYTLSLPLAITPRYSPGTRSTYETVSAEPQRADIEVELSPGFPVASLQSLHHRVDVKGTGSERITASVVRGAADRDFELVWTPVVASDAYATAFTEEVGGESYALVVVTPPQELAMRAPAREVLFIIDTSGSMEGTSLTQAKAALKLGVERLGSDDHFNIIRFSDDASALFEAPHPADDTARALAMRFTSALAANGGTEMRAALQLAFALPVVEGKLRQIVFITDGSVGNESELLALIHERLGAARLFTVGIGSAPNAYFMREAAIVGRGSYTFIPGSSLVSARMADLFRKLEEPALIDLALAWPGGVSAELAAGLPPDVYAGDPLVIAARLPARPSGVLTLTGRSPNGPWTRQLPLIPADANAGIAAGIAKLWARERIAELGRRKHLGELSDDEARAAIVRLALQHHLVSEYTSLIAVDDTPVRPVDVTAKPMQAPTSAPAGTAWARTTGFAQTATPASLLALIGALLLCTALILRRSVRA